MSRRNSKSKNKSENLFLLEFLVDRVEIYQKSLPRELACIAGETCVSFSIFDQKPLTICENDLKCPGQSPMKNGKSCLFCLSPEECKDVQKAFDVEIGLFKSYDCPFLPTKLQVGRATLSIKSEFNKIARRLGKKKKVDNPIVVTKLFSKTITGILSGAGCCMGEINIFIRLTCYGKNIVTGFQMNVKEQSVFFKDKKGLSTYKNFLPSPCSGPLYCYYSQQHIKSKSTTSFNSQKSCDSHCPGPDECLGKDDDNNHVVKNVSGKYCPIGNFPPCSSINYPPFDVVIPPRLPGCKKMPHSILTCGVKSDIHQFETHPNRGILSEQPHTTPAKSKSPPFYVVTAPKNFPPLNIDMPCRLTCCKQTPESNLVSGGQSEKQLETIYTQPLYQPSSCYILPDCGCSSCSTCYSPCGYPCKSYPYGLPPCGTAPCALMGNGPPPCGASCGSPPYGVPPCRPSFPCKPYKCLPEPPYQCPPTPQIQCPPVPKYQCLPKPQYQCSP